LLKKKDTANIIRPSEQTLDDIGENENVLQPEYAAIILTTLVWTSTVEPYM